MLFFNMSSVYSHYRVYSCFYAFITHARVQYHLLLPWITRFTWEPRYCPNRENYIYVHSQNNIKQSCTCQYFINPKNSGDWPLLLLRTFVSCTNYRNVLSFHAITKIWLAWDSMFLQIHDSPHLSIEIFKYLVICFAHHWIARVPLVVQ